MVYVEFYAHREYLSAMTEFDLEALTRHLSMGLVKRGEDIWLTKFSHDRATRHTL